jgi:hypothetical protein
MSAAIFLTLAHLLIMQLMDPLKTQGGRMSYHKEVRSYLKEVRSYQALSIRDLLEARDAYHVFLMRKKNVIGTAIGKYRIRKKDVPRTEPKTLENTELQEYSWPCVIAFVDTWIDIGKFGKRGGISTDEVLPERLFLPDGREIPVCVIKAAWQQKRQKTILQMKFPGSVIGGGYPVMTRVQGEERWSTLSCLVSDGRLTYGLTNSHVAGRPGENLLTMRNGNMVKIGVSAQKQLQKKPFTEVYEGFAGKHSLVNLDIGLIELTDLEEITARVFGLEELKGIADVNHDTLSLRLVGCPVMGYGCASGLMRGEIVALFYRYGVAGGYDYVTDYLIGPREVKAGDTALSFSPAHGDSGTLLVIDDPKSVEDHMKAIGVIWGGQKDISGNQEQGYALATNLGTICRLLDVELVSNWNTGYDTYFGAFAHITLPSLCAGIVMNEKLKELMENNQIRFSMPLKETLIGETKGLSNDWFVPLSDVPDLVWKGWGQCSRRYEGPNHYADMDQPNPQDQDRTLVDICKDVAKIDPDVWLAYYEAVHADTKGALPFRIAQIYDSMVKSLQHGKIAEFICAAGILTHYVFDACMPLHISYMYNGDPNGPKKPGTDEPLAAGIHGEFDNQMVEYFADTIRAHLPNLVEEKAETGVSYLRDHIITTKDAAVMAVTLMANTVETHAPPKAIVKDYEDLYNWEKKARCAWFWQKYGGGIMQAMAEAVVLAAGLWEAAWLNGNGAQMVQSTEAVSEEELKIIYETREGFLDSVSLEEIKSKMDWNSQ